MADEIAKYTGQYNVQDFDAYFDKVIRYPNPAGAQRGYIPMTDGNGQMILHSMTDPGSESEANANIAPLETGPTASQTYAVGDLLVYQGQLMTVVQAIEQGGSITPGTNVMSYTVAQALQQKANQAAMDAALAGKANQSDVDTDLGKKATVMHYPLAAGESVEINTGTGQFCVLITHTASAIGGLKGLYLVSGYFTGASRRNISEIVHSEAMTVTSTNAGFSLLNTLDGGITVHVIVIAGLSWL